MKNVVITTANNMSEKTFQFICDGFKSKYNHDELSFKRIINDEIIGGFIADINGEIFDLSISSQLENMRKHIEG